MLIFPALIKSGFRRYLHVLNAEHYKLTAYLCNLAHFIYVSLLLLKLSEGRLDGSDGCIMVGSLTQGREPTGVVEPGNVDGRGRRRDYHRSRRRAGWAWCGCGCGCVWGRGWWRCAWFLVWFGLDLQKERREMMCGNLLSNILFIYSSQRDKKKNTAPLHSLTQTLWHIFPFFWSYWKNFNTFKDNVPQILDKTQLYKNYRVMYRCIVETPSESKKKEEETSQNSRVI